MGGISRRFSRVAQRKTILDYWRKSKVVAENREAELSNRRSTISIIDPRSSNQEIPD